MTTLEKVVGETKVCVVTGLQAVKVRNCPSIATKGKRFFLAPKRLGWHLGPPSFLFLSRQGEKLITHFHLGQNLNNVQSYLHSFIYPHVKQSNSFNFTNI
jgi:hypothetical protein